MLTSFCSQNCPDQYCGIATCTRTVRTARFLVPRNCPDQYSGIATIPCLCEPFDSQRSLGIALISTVGLRSERNARPSSRPEHILGIALISTVGLRQVSELVEDGPEQATYSELPCALISTVELRPQNTPKAAVSANTRNCPDQYSGLATWSFPPTSSRMSLSELP